MLKLKRPSPPGAVSVPAAKAARPVAAADVIAIDVDSSGDEARASARIRAPLPPHGAAAAAGGGGAAGRRRWSARDPEPKTLARSLFVTARSTMRGRCPCTPAEPLAFFADGGLVRFGVKAAREVCARGAAGRGWGGAVVAAAAAAMLVVVLLLVVVGVGGGGGGSGSM